MPLYFWIAFGSALGGTARFALSGLVAERIGETFPWGTLVVNVSGSFAIGLFATLTDPDGRVLMGATGRHFVVTGILGGFTTYSSFSLQTLTLAREGQWLQARRQRHRNARAVPCRRVAGPCVRCGPELPGKILVMNLPSDSVMLRIFIGESDRHGGHPLYESIVLKAREAGLAGATVLRSPMGFGAASRLHTAKILRLSDDLPMIIEIVDAEERINGFLPLLESMMGGGLVTLEPVKVIHYRHWSGPMSGGQPRSS